MDSSEYSNNSSFDVGEEEIKHRERDDMLSRRLGGNIPAPLRKKKEDNYKRFITPSGNPMNYVKQHMRSKSLSDLQIQNEEKEQERDARNFRYEEMQKLKEMLKEEEETWTSNLNNWKQRRRSATMDVRKRKEDRENVEVASSVSRKPKTYREIVEEKKRRESGLIPFNDDDDDLFDSLPKVSSIEVDAPLQGNRSNKMQYRGAVSVPDFNNIRADRVKSQSPSPPSAKEPVKYTSSITTVINHNPSKSDDAISAKSNRLSPRTIEQKPPNLNRVTRRLGTVWPPTSSSSSHYNISKASQQPAATSTRPSYVVAATRRTFSPTTRPQVSNNAVTMRNTGKVPDKERPKSAYGNIDGNRSFTLPRNYYSIAHPKPLETNLSDFVKKRKSAFANKRSMWENIAHQKQDGPPPAPQHLASLLKHDTERLNDTSTISSSITLPQHNPSRSPNSIDYSASSSETTSPRQSSLANESIDHRSKVMNSTDTDQSNKSLPPWQRFDFNQNKPDSKLAHKHVSSPANRSTAVKSATLPLKAKLNPEDKSMNVVSKQQDILYQQNGINQELSSSPRSNGIDLESSHSDEMKICINQRPRSEKGFGFTVKGGDDGKPVVVSTVNPGGAADICQLCVGDEILAINDVRLSPSLTQEDIVQLIVDSVMIGNLSLDIKRYGKSKKPNPLRLSGTKVVMTSGGFVQVRSDKGKPPVVSTKTYNNGPFSHAPEQDSSIQDLPPPPKDFLVSSREFPLPTEDPKPSKHRSAVDRLSPKKPAPSAMKRASPLSNLINAAKSTSARPQDINHVTVPGKENEKGFRHSPFITNHSTKNDISDDLEFEVLKAQQDLEMEEKYLEHERRQHEDTMNLRKELLEEQRLLEEREAKREEEKRLRIEEAKAEEQRLEEELKKIEAAKLEQQKRRKEENRRLIESQSFSRFDSTFNPGGTNHWLIEEAERSRLADEEGRRRANILDLANPNRSTTPLSNHSMPRFTQRDSRLQNSQPSIPGSLANYWNDPNTRATLL